MLFHHRSFAPSPRYRSYYPFLHAVTDEICADLYDPSAAWRSSAFLNASGTAASLLAGFDAQLAEWSCEAGALVWYSTSSQASLV